MISFFRTFFLSFRIKPYLSSLILFLLLFQMVLEGSNLFSLVSLLDLMIHPDQLNPVTQKAIELLKGIKIEPTLPVFIFLVGLITLLKFGGLFFILVMLSKFQRGMDLHLTTDLYSTLFSSRWPYFTSNNIGTLVEIIAGKCHNASNAFFYTFQFFFFLSNLVVYSIVPMLISFKITLGCLVIGSVVLFPLLFAGRFYFKIAKKKELILNEYTQYLVESLSAAKMIFAYSLSRININRFSQISRQHRRKLFQQDVLAGGINLLNEPISIFLVLVLIYLFLFQSKGEISALVVIIYALKKVMASAHSCVHWYNTYKSVRPAIDIIKEESAKARSFSETSGTLEHKYLKDNIKFIDTEFFYTPGKHVIKGINLTINKGEMTAFVGGSGEGKTTIVDLIVGLYRPTSGKILVDGVDLWDYDLETWRRTLGYISQETFLFNATIKENILWGTERSVTDENLFDAAKRASAHEFILNCMDGYNTIVGDRGVRLSGGQVQRIALARAILRKPQILLLDEATSSLDSESEEKIQKSIEELAREITIVVIAHRLSTIRSADKIYILNKGGVVGEGSFNELMRANAIFRKYTDLQEIRA